jgi:hypothetical protein
MALGDHSQEDQKEMEKDKARPIGLGHQHGERDNSAQPVGLGHQHGENSKLA